MAQPIPLAYGRKTGAGSLTFEKDLYDLFSWSKNILGLFLCFVDLYTWYTEIVSRIGQFG